MYEQKEQEEAGLQIAVALLRYRTYFGKNPQIATGGEDLEKFWAQQFRRRRKFFVAPRRKFFGVFLLAGRRENFLGVLFLLPRPKDEFETKNRPLQQVRRKSAT